MIPRLRLRLPGLLLLLALLAPAAAPAAAQAPVDAALAPYGTGAGGQVLLTNSGFGLGGYYHWALSPRTSVISEVSLRPTKDESEVTFFDRFGRKDIRNKANYLLTLPVQLGVQRRVFQAHIEDNFRPFVQASTGPTIGWEYPYFDDCNGSGALDAADCDQDGVYEEEDTYDALSGIPRGRVRLGLGGTLAVGAHFGFSTRSSQGVRIGYAFTYFFQPVQLLEPAVQDAQHFFGTPIISLTFGRLF